MVEIFSDGGGIISVGLGFLGELEAFPEGEG